MKKFLFLLLLLCALPCGCVTPIGAAIGQQLAVYPESRAQDIYKSFCQDRLGPGHLIPDREAARRYLMSELDDYRADLAAGRYELPAERFFPTGDQGRFMRVDLSVVLDGTVSAEALLDAFVESANQGPWMSPEAWAEEWGSIARILRKEFPEIPDLERDLQQIDSLMASGQYILHHSPAYEAAYHPHYRIIESSLFEALDLR